MGSKQQTNLDPQRVAAAPSARVTPPLQRAANRSSALSKYYPLPQRDATSWPKGRVLQIQVDELPKRRTFRNERSKLQTNYLKRDAHPSSDPPKLSRRDHDHGRYPDYVRNYSQIYYGMPDVEGATCDFATRYPLNEEEEEYEYYSTDYERFPDTGRTDAADDADLRRQETTTNSTQTADDVKRILNLLVEETESIESRTDVVEDYDTFMKKVNKYFANSIGNLLEANKELLKAKKKSMIATPTDLYEDGREPID